MATLKDIAFWLQAEVLAGAGHLQRRAGLAHSCDLMSDVLSYSRPDSILLTGLTNEQVMRTAEVAGICGVIIARGKAPPEAVVALAEEYGLPLMLTGLSLFDASGLLYSHGLRGCSSCE